MILPLYVRKSDIRAKYFRSQRDCYIEVLLKEYVICGVIKLNLLKNLKSTGVHDGMGVEKWLG